MSTTYTGDRTATEAPSPAPGLDVSPQVVIPADGVDDVNAASIAQALKVPADFIDWITHHMDVRDYQPGVRFRENWIQYMAAMVQPQRPWRVLSTIDDGNGFVATSPTPSPCIQISPGHVSTDNLWIVTGEVDPGDATRVLTNTGGFFDSSYTSAVISPSLEWRAAMSVIGANNTKWQMGWTDAVSTANAYQSNAAYFRKASADTNWQAVTHAGGVDTVVDTGVPPTAFGWQQFRIEWDFTGTPTVRFYINGNLVATNTTHVPSMYGRIGFGAERSGASTSYLLVGPVAARASVA